MRSLERITHYSRPLLARSWHSLDELTGAGGSVRQAVQQPLGGEREQLTAWENEGGTLQAGASRQRHRLRQAELLAGLGMLLILSVLASAAGGALGWF